MPIILREDEYGKLGSKSLTIPRELAGKLARNMNMYSGDEYKGTKGYKRLHSLLNNEYNDPNGKKGGVNNQRYVTFADAKRIENDMRSMDQSKDNPEYDMIGGDDMRNWLQNSLASLRYGVKKVSEVPEVPKTDKGATKPDNVKPKEIQMGKSKVTIS